jgi:hypothetical protein
MTASLSLSAYGLPTGSSLVVDIAFAIVFALLGYHLSRRHRMLRGVTPWRLPSIAWAVICLFLQPIGIIVELVAEFTTRPAQPVAHPDAPDGYHAVATSSATAITLDPHLGHDRASGSGHLAPPPADESGRSALFGWYTDVTKRHELRYWDGKQWSDHVSDVGTLSTDPL